MNSVGKRIKSLRLDKGLTQTELGNLVDLSTTAIFYLENGNTKTSVRLNKIAEIFDVNVVWLETGIGNPSQTYSHETLEVIRLMENQTDNIGRGKCLYSVREIVEFRNMLLGTTNLAISEAQATEMKNQLKSWDFSAKNQDHIRTSTNPHLHDSDPPSK